MTLPLDRRVVLAGGLGLMAGPALAQTGDGLVRVAIKTAKGVITVDLDVGKAPITAGNFLKYVDRRLFDASTFYRASRAKGAPDIGVIEGGTRGDPAKSLKPIPHESTLKTGLPHKDGTISMARRAPGTAAGDFFICIGDQPSFDARPDAPGDNVGFAAFGQVVDGMDVARAILVSPTSPTAGVGVMRGEMLKPTVEIVSVRRVKA
jgi:peptidyl-prolyl cis-trans isomerase A (cyclophilin A)